MRVPVIDKNKTVVTTLDIKEGDTFGVIFIGSGLARRTFRYNGKDALPSCPDNGAAFEEVETKTIFMDQQPVVDVAPNADMIVVQLSPGHRVSVMFADSDGQLIISYDHNNDQKLFVWTDIPGNVCGDRGVLYCEDFAKKDPRVADKVLMEQLGLTKRDGYPGEQISSFGGMFGNRTGED